MKPQFGDTVKVKNLQINDKIACSLTRSGKKAMGRFDLDQSVHSVFHRAEFFARR